MHLCVFEFVGEDLYTNLLLRWGLPLLYVGLGAGMWNVPQNGVYGVRIGPTFRHKDIWQASNRLASMLFTCVGFVLLLMFNWVTDELHRVLLMLVLTLAAAVPPIVLAYRLEANKRKR